MHQETGKKLPLPVTGTSPALDLYKGEDKSAGKFSLVQFKNRLLVFISASDSRYMQQALDTNLLPDVVLFQIHAKVDFI